MPGVAGSPSRTGFCDRGRRGLRVAAGEGGVAILDQALPRLVVEAGEALVACLGELRHRLHVLRVALDRRFVSLLGEGAGRGLDEVALRERERREPLRRAMRPGRLVEDLAALPETDAGAGKRELGEVPRRRAGHGRVLGEDRLLDALDGAVDDAVPVDAARPRLPTALPRRRRLWGSRGGVP
jgi:hypothetical protein